MTLALAQIEALRELERAWPGRSIVLIGAAALGFYYDMRWRSTADMDLVVAAELDEFPLGLDTRVGWTPSARRPHEFRAPSGAKVDIVPAGPRLLAAGAFTWADGHVMNLVGMDLAFRHAVAHELGDGHGVEVAPPPVVAILKMAAYLDRPAARTRDLQDLAHLLDAYVDEESERRFDEGAAAGGWAITPAYLLGLDLAAIAEPSHRGLVDRFVDAVQDLDAVAHAEMERSGPIHWRTEHEQQGPLQRRLAAFQRAWRGGFATP